MFKDFGRRLMRDIKRKVDGRLEANQAKVRYTDDTDDTDVTALKVPVSSVLLASPMSHGMFRMSPFPSNVFTSPLTSPSLLPSLLPSLPPSPP